MNRFIIYLFLFFNLACIRNSSQSKNSEIERNTNVTEEKSFQTNNDSITIVAQSEDVTKKTLIEDSPDIISDEKAELSISFLTLTWDTWGTLIIILVISFLILLIGSISMFRRNTTLNKEVNKKNGKLNDKDASIRNLEFEVNCLKSRIKKLNNETVPKKDQSGSKKAETLPTPVSNRISVVEETGAYEKEWSVKKEELSQSHSTRAVQKILYADKATENRVFSSVSEQQHEHRSVFKLILENSDSDKAEFEIVNSDYILKMAVNSPDTYLYPVCKPENSNQNYSGEIITTRKGIAHKVDGKWTVNEDDKATIKFQ